MKISKDVQLATQQLMTQLKRAENPYTQVATGDQTPIDKEAAELSEGSRQALALIKTSGIPVDQQTQQAVSSFMDQGPGTVKEKLEALATALAKDIPLKAEALNALRIAKTGSLADYLGPAAKPSGRSVRDHGTSEVRRSEVRRSEVRKSDARGSEVSTTELSDIELIGTELIGTELIGTELSGTEFRGTIFSGAKVKSSLANSIALGSSEATIAPRILEESLSQLDALLEAMLETLSTEKGDKSVNYGDKSIFKGENIGIMPSGNVDNSVEISQNEAASQAELSSALEALSEMVSQIGSEELMHPTGLGDQVRLVLERTVTPRLLAVQEHFRSQVKTIAGQLDRIMAKTDPAQGKQLNHQERVVQLDKVIDELDQLVMKSEASLFLSLKGEKRLIAISSQVDSAKQQLMKGALPEAERLVKAVVQSLSEMKLEPTLKRVLGLPSFGSATDLEGLSKAYAVGNDRFAAGEKSAVGILNFLRKLGLNHEPELYQKAFGQEISVDPTGPSLKEKLIKLTQMGSMGSGPSDDGSADAIRHITGQQLANRVVDKPQLQQMSFAIPVAQGGVTHQMQVLIQTPQDRLKADWKTFDMVFMLSTPKVGDVGIKVRSVDLKLSVEIINDSVEREALFKPLVAALMADLGDMGFTATSVTFKGWQAKSQGAGADKASVNGQKEGPADGQPMSLAQAKAAVRDAREGGFDIKI